MSRSVAVAPRGARGLVIAICSLVLAAVAHSTAGGHLPEIDSVLLFAVPLACATAWFVRRTRTPGAIAAFLAATQLGLHWAFSPATALSADPGPHAHAVHVVGSHAHSHGLTPTMIVAHACAVLVIAAVLGRGEQLLARLWAWFFRPRVAEPAAPPVRQSSPRPMRQLPRPRTICFSNQLTRRGPPPHGFVPVLA